MSKCTTAMDYPDLGRNDGKILIRKGRLLIDPATGKRYTVAQAARLWKYRVVAPMGEPKIKTPEDNAPQYHTK